MGAVRDGARVAPIAWITPVALALALGACGGDDGTSHEAVAPSASAPGAPPSARPGVAATQDDDREPGFVSIGEAPVGVPTAPARPSGPAVRPPSGPARGDATPPSGTRPSVLEGLANDPELIEPLPELAAVEVTGSGLQIAYTTDAQREAIDPDYVEAQWQYMQSCTGLVAQAPVVQVVDGDVTPILPSDDVVLAIDGAALATSSTGEGGTALQVSAAELAPGAVRRGFALRAIIGRWLWQDASLPERDYPFGCASQAPAEDG